jgi:hypothetical protein
MSNPTRTDGHSVAPDTAQLIQAQGNPPLPGALPFLLQADPEAIIEIRLVDYPIDLPQDQFEALLFESECEV